MRSECAWCEVEVDANETTSSNQSEAGGQKQGPGFSPDSSEIENCNELLVNGYAHKESMGCSQLRHCRP